ncbi:type IV pilus secretin PilQ [Motiliproteus coralliicola]|uniref:Type IV pilus secretin PilQ n=1 Tax=Motiliproteus coralliicola TaxID=2283196 RepID=A0A369WD08_9GAMM|nr:type IV pilus secretin PilQ [Motiliproteus coralliicola]RDE19193.1 type IV pilus secretin PilQ [Motiliproteus coralliicola]
MANLLSSTTWQQARQRLAFTSRKWLGLVTCLLLSQTTLAEVQIVDSAFVTLPGNKLELRLDFDAAPPLPRSYKIEQPARVVLDLHGASNGLSSKSIEIKTGLVDTLHLAEVKDRVRVIANLYESVEYDTYIEGNSLFVVFGAGAGDTVAAAQPKQGMAMDNADTTNIPRPLRTQISSIDFRRVDGNIGRVFINMTDSKAGVDIIEEGNNVIVNLIGAQLPAALEERVDVQDFSTPVTFVDAMADGNNSSILIKPSALPYDYLAYQSDNQLIVDFKPVTDTEAEERQRERFPYTGEKLSLNFQDIDIRSVLQIIADVTDMNLVVSDTVSGNITLRLKNVPWDQALELVLKTKSLDKRITGNVMMIAPAAEIAERERFEIETNKQVRELKEPQTEFIQVNYAKASDIVSLLGTEQGLLSERGAVQADPRTNTLIVRDIDTSIAKIRKALKKLDIPVRQVMIEARLVTVRADLSKELGVKWGFGHVKDGGTRIALGATAPGNTAQAGGSAGLTVPSSLNVDLGATSIGASRFAIGVGSNTTLLQMELSALETDGSAEIISQPKVITANGMPARIQSGDEIPFQTVEDGEVNVEFKEVVLALDVTPQITPDNRLILDLKINQDSVGEELPNGEVGIVTNELETQVLVNNGETVVLGGVFQKEQTQSISKVPVLGDLPVLGKLFTRTNNSNQKSELLVFITPKIISESLSTR